VYVVPLRWNQQIPLATFHIQVAERATRRQSGNGDQRAAAAPTLRLSDRDRVLEFEPGNDRTWTAEKTLEQVAFDGDLTIRLPGAAPAPLVSVEAFAPAQEGTGASAASEKQPECFFALRDVRTMEQEAAATATPTGLAGQAPW
jgi:hypothetical protein